MATFEFSRIFVVIIANTALLECVKFVGFRNVQFSSCMERDGTYAQITGVSCGQCVDACSLRTSCSFVTFRRSSKQCRLFRTFGNRLSIVKRASCVLVAKKDIDASSVPSQCQQCRGIQVCDKLTGACKTVECPRLYIANGQVSGNVRTVGSRLLITCIKKYGSSEDGARATSVTCQPNGSWSKGVTCVKDCMAPPSIPNAVVTYNSTSHTSKAFYKCDDSKDYYEYNKLNETEMTGVCDATNGTWNVSEINCVKDCPSRTRVYNGNFTTLDGGSPTKEAGVMLKLVCNDGYFNDQSTPYHFWCDGRTGKWMYFIDVSMCVKNCTDPPEVINADRRTTDNRPYSQVEYTCLYGNKVTFTAKCDGSSGTWTGVMDCPTGDQCTTYLVSGNHGVNDASLTAKSFYADKNMSGEPFRARLHTLENATHYGGWRAGASERQYIQVKFQELQTVSSVVTQGLNGRHMWVTSYTVRYSTDCRNFEVVMTTNGKIAIFPANTDSDSEVENVLPFILTARCVKIMVTTYNTSIGMRFDLKGCIDQCTTYLVSGIHGVKDASMTAKSFYADKNMSGEPFRARLHTLENATHYGGWRAGASEWQYIQVRFRALQKVSSVVTQGLNGRLIWVTSYTVRYSTDCKEFEIVRTTGGKSVIFPANTDSDSEVENVLPFILTARCVRIMVTTYNTSIGMRFDLKGCIDYVCPSSPERFITPGISSSLALRIMSGSYTKEGALSACKEHGHLVKLDTEEKEKTVLNMIKNCEIYANTTYWVDGKVETINGVTMMQFSDGSMGLFQNGYTGNQAINNECMGLTVSNTFVFQPYPCVADTFGYICEFRVRTA